MKASTSKTKSPPAPPQDPAPRSNRRRFAPPVQLTSSISELLDEQIDDGAMSIEWIAVDRIQFDPDQPRKLQLDRDNLENIPDGPNGNVLREQLERLRELAASIEANGMVQAVAVYRHGDGFRLAWGERRLLAHKLLGRTSIRAEMLPARPSGLRVKQIIENIHRDDLSLPERIAGIAKLRDTTKADGSPESLRNADDLARVLGFRKSTAYAYWGVITGPEDIRHAINDGRITAIAVAYKLATIADPAERAAALELAVTGESAPESTIPEPPSPGTATKKGTRPVGRPMKHISLGKTQSPNVARYIVERLLTTEEFKPFADMDWNDLRVAGDILKQVIKKIETQVQEGGVQ